MIDPAAYPKPVPLSREDTLALLNSGWADVPGTFLAYMMIPVEQRIGEWRFAGAARSLAAAYERLVEFWVALGGDVEPETGRPSFADWLSWDAVEFLPRLEDGWSGVPYLDGLSAHRVVVFAEGQAPYDDTGLCILEVEPAEGEPFFAREPETDRPPEWGEQEGAEEDEDEE